jgi:hypothetical protein
MALTRADTEKRQLASSSQRGILGRSSSMNEIAATATEISSGVNTAQVPPQPMLEVNEAANAAATAAALKQNEASLLEAQHKIAELTKENNRLSEYLLWTLRF